MRRRSRRWRRKATPQLRTETRESRLEPRASDVIRAVIEHRIVQVNAASSIRSCVLPSLPYCAVVIKPMGFLPKFQRSRVQITVRPVACQLILAVNEEKRKCLHLRLCERCQREREYQAHAECTARRQRALGANDQSCAGSECQAPTGQGGNFQRTTR